VVLPLALEHLLDPPKTALDRLLHLVQRRVVGFHGEREPVLASPLGSTVIEERSSMGASRITAAIVRRSGSYSMISISPSTEVSPIVRSRRILVPTPIGPGVSWTRLIWGSQRGWFWTWSVATKRNTSAGWRSIDSDTLSFTAAPPAAAILPLSASN
jgi:hypothetical protein